MIPPLCNERLVKPCIMHFWSIENMACLPCMLSGFPGMNLIPCQSAMRVEQSSIAKRSCQAICDTRKPAKHYKHGSLAWKIIMPSRHAKQAKQLRKTRRYAKHAHLLR
jgi:hypothetical protein